MLKSVMKCSMQIAWVNIIEIVNERDVNRDSQLKRQEKTCLSFAHDVLSAVGLQSNTVEVKLFFENVFFLFLFFFIMHCWYNLLQSTQLLLLFIQCPRNKSRGGIYWSRKMCPRESHVQSQHTSEEESEQIGHPSKMKLKVK